MSPGIDPAPFRGRPRAPRTQSGYTLIEVIVAFALLALALTLLLGTLSGATRQVGWAGDAGRAALHAQSLLDQQGIGEPIEPGERTGEFDDGRFRWALGVTPWTDPALPPAGPQPVASSHQLYRLHLAVVWGEGGPRQRLDLQTLRLVQAPGLQAEAFP